MSQEQSGKVETVGDTRVRLDERADTPDEEAPRSTQKNPKLKKGNQSGRVVSSAVLWAWKRGLIGVGMLGRAWGNFKPAQQLVLGFVAYVICGTVLLCLPWAQAQPTHWLDNLFNTVSAVSTTGLTTVSVADRYTFLGEAVIMLLFQAGGIGFMTLSSVLILARGKNLTASRLGVLKMGFTLPHYFKMKDFIVQVVVFTFICEVVGAGVLWWRFSALGLESPLWFAAFHSVSAFATAGFGLHNSSLEAYAGNWVVNLTIGVLSYLGAIGFIVVQDVWYSIRLRERMLTFTSQVILWMTGGVFVLGTLALYVFEESVRDQEPMQRLMMCAFQIMSASSTAGFNTIPIGSMSKAGLVLIMIAMLIGASPSGTGGGIKTTSVSAILGNLMSVLRGRKGTAWLGYEIPLQRVLFAFAASSLYLILLIVGVLSLAITESKEFLPLVFEAASAIGTVGLSMGITGDLSAAGKWIVIALMFVGRCGPLTIGFSLLTQEDKNILKPDDLAV